MSDFSRWTVPPDEIEQHYFQWLCHLVHADVPGDSYYEMCRLMYREPFIPKIPHDDNRAVDCEQLRDEFASLVYYPEYPFRHKPCRFLEMLISFAWRIQDSLCDPTDDRRVEWFWTMIENLELDDCRDSKRFKRECEEKVLEAIDRVNNRTYSRDGKGGLFPLDHPPRDQRKVELWYQVNTYLLEKEPLDD